MIARRGVPRLDLLDLFSLALTLASTLRARRHSLRGQGSGGAALNSLTLVLVRTRTYISLLLVALFCASSDQATEELF